MSLRSFIAIKIKYIISIFTFEKESVVLITINKIYFHDYKYRIYCGKIVN